MKPEVDVVLNTGGRTLLTQIMPALDNSHFAGSTYILSMLLNFAAQEFERGAENRVKDNAEMRAIFDEAAAHVADPVLAAKLAQAARGAESSLLISELNRANDALKELLIALHRQVEQCAEPWAKACEGRILGHLLHSALRHQLALPGAA